jgi:hypothetical protein
MKQISFFFLFFCALTHGFAQNASILSEEKSAAHTPTINYNTLYLDAAVGYYPQPDNASWATQLSIGTRLNDESALGIGGAYWGRIQAYRRSALGIGIEYRRSFWENFIAKIEGGYLLNRTMYDDVLKNNLRFLNRFTVGISACQSGDLFFRRMAGLGSETVDSWRINAFTVQLGIALEGQE